MNAAHSPRRTRLGVRRLIAAWVGLGVGAVLLGLAPPIGSPATAPGASTPLARLLAAGPVTGVGGVDADTIEVLVRGRRVEVDLRGLSAPIERGRGVPFGPESSYFVHNLTVGERLELSGITVDESGRAAAYAHRMPDGLDVNAELVRTGMLRADSDQRHPRSPEFHDLQDRAAVLQKGLWGTRRVERAAPAPAVEGTEPAGRTDGPRGADPEREPGAVDPDAPAGLMLFVTRSGSRYHRDTCRYARSGSARAVPLSEVGDRTPCAICRPPPANPPADPPADRDDEGG